MSDKPSYLGLLNAIAVNEAKAHRYLSVWIETTDDPEVRAVLRTVAAREGEHGMSFARRIDELGYTVRYKSAPRAVGAAGASESSRGSEDVSVASSELSDLEKIEKLGLHELDKTLCGLDDIFKDHSIDIRTGELLGRYIAEEFDSARLLRSCWEQLRRRAGEVREQSVPAEAS
ncbi:MAG TPA: hypothetical protein VMR97_08880 [Acidimicrobiales bacterium]|nr:hypothetical protein [Acidimicrobiales bacterium]